MRHSTAFATLALAAVLVGFAGKAAAQGDDRDPRLADLASRARESIEASRSVHARMSAKPEIPGVGQDIPAFEIELWRKGDNLREEIPHENEIGITTRNEAFSYRGSTGVMLYVPPETMKEFADQRDGALRQLGLPQDQDEAFVAMLEKDMATIVGEKEYDGVPCLVLEVKPEYTQAFVESSGFSVANDLDPDVEQTRFVRIQIALEAETSNVRRMYMDMLVRPTDTAVDVTVNVTLTVLEYELDAQIPDELFSFEAPEGTRVVEWTPGRTPDEVRQEMRDAIAAAQGEQPAAPPEA